MKREAGARRLLHPEAAGLDPSAPPRAAPEPFLPPSSPAPAHGETSSEAVKGSSTYNVGIV